ncbi:hypothetical protein [Luteolibacter luteus]|uniref:DUF485 domain-containing protein n=1 Tax=Luteolibacter luteus TaxID=2728835 RepID=A0A858RSR1_9BACT|nr:hypothetical protein [Luteolibacter luteus]QJE99013.1 hypothetical protein HHL09_25610 [Luteolibacter luteus]
MFQAKDEKFTAELRNPDSVERRLRRLASIRAIFTFGASGMSLILFILFFSGLLVDPATSSTALVGFTMMIFIALGQMVYAGLAHSEIRTILAFKTLMESKEP